MVAVGDGLLVSGWWACQRITEELQRKLEWSTGWVEHAVVVGRAGKLLEGSMRLRLYRESSKEVG